MIPAERISSFFAVKVNLGPDVRGVTYRIQAPTDMEGLTVSAHGKLDFAEINALVFISVSIVLGGQDAGDTRVEQNVHIVACVSQVPASGTTPETFLDRSLTPTCKNHATPSAKHYIRDRCQDKPTTHRFR